GLLGAARRRLIGRQAVALRTAAAYAGWLVRQAVAARPFVGPDAVTQWRGAVERASAAEVREVAQTLLPSEGMVEAFVEPGPPAARAQ
ncbi:MAG: hypothetical protein KC583_14245, partial [Myxococcales bacterium]|nr:hypothetical protein [Myxococcales bacterium]